VGGGGCVGAGKCWGSIHKIGEGEKIIVSIVFGPFI